MDIKEFSQSRKITIGLVALGVFVLLCAAFSVGEHIGYHKAAFTFQNSNNFYRTYGPPGGNMPPGGFSDDHGTAGKVVSVTLPTITIEDRDNTEKTVLINSQTIIRRFRDTITAQDIAAGDYVVAIGEPNAQSQVVANLIRILPPAQTGSPQ
jgi:hypothetical protein